MGETPEGYALAVRMDAFGRTSSNTVGLV
jgi:hypothetical protein